MRFSNIYIYIHFEEISKIRLNIKKHAFLTTNAAWLAALLRASLLFVASSQDSLNRCPTSRGTKTRTPISDDLI